MSPTQRTLAYLKENGYKHVAIVERWNPHARIRQDLFNFIDILAVKDGFTYAFQVTSGSNVSKRFDKILEECEPQTRAVLCAGWIVFIHGWRKVKVKRGGKAMKWDLREEPVTLEMLNSQPT